MVDHEGHVKELSWHIQQTGQRDAVIFATVDDYANPAAAPERLLPHSTPPCDAAACAAALAGTGPVVSALSALEAVLLATLLGVLLAWLGSLLMLRKRRQPETPTTVDDPSAPLVLADLPRHTGRSGADWPACSLSSCVTKVEAILRFAGAPYSKQVGYPDAAALPTAHPPFLEQDGQRVGGSRPIIQHLAATGTVPAALLHPTALGDRAAALALARMCDTDLAAALVYYRWVDDEGWERCRWELVGPYRLLPPVAAVVARMARKACYTRCMEQGIGCLSEADRLGLVAEELGALAQLLDDQAFVFGDSPHAVDASVFGVLDQMAARALNPQLSDLVAAHPNLVAYRERIRSRYFGADYQRAVVWVDGGSGGKSAAATLGSKGSGEGAEAVEGRRKDE